MYKTAEISGHTMAVEVILMNMEEIRKSAAFRQLPRLMQVTMLHSGALPQTEAGLQALARHLKAE